MRILLIHQNFPGQFKHLGPALASRGDQVVALTPKVKKPITWKGVKVMPYFVPTKKSIDIHPLVTGLENKIIFAEACYHAAVKVRGSGFEPDVILTHYGWGESLFLKDVWPQARTGLYCEMYYDDKSDSINFDPEFAIENQSLRSLRLRVENITNHLHFNLAQAGLSPTQFQADTYPPSFRQKITVIHDGVDTDHVKPNPDAILQINDRLMLTRQDEVITFVNRNFEPYRGYHRFMRALPELLGKRPQAQIVLIGGDSSSYSRPAPKGKTWKQVFIDRVRSDISDADWQRVHFLGRVPYEIFLSALQVSRVHVYLSYPFVVSWSLIEAMSSECAIVANGTTAIKEVIKSDKTGLLVDFFDLEALVAKVVSLLKDEAKRRQLGMAARAVAMNKYDLQTHCLPKQIEWVDRVAALPVIRPEDKKV